MPIIRQEFTFELTKFTQIPNDWLRDERLSLKAKGLLAQLMSHAPGWQLSIQKLAQTNNCGKHTITVAIQELENAGYLVRQQTKDDKGRFGESLWFTAEPTFDYPMSENPTSDSPTSENRTTKNTNPKKTKVKNTQEAFDQFWSIYPRKAGKAQARKVFDKLAGENLADIMSGVRRLAEDPNLPPTEYIPHPATWLNREGWHDDPYPKRSRGEDGKPVKPPAETPGYGTWKLWYHDQGDHTFCVAGVDCDQKTD